MKDFRDLTDRRMNKAAQWALDLTRAYAAGYRTATTEHLERDRPE